MQLIKLIVVCFLTFMLVFAGSITWATLTASHITPSPPKQYVPETTRWNKEIKQELEKKSKTKQTKGASQK